MEAPQLKSVLSVREPVLKDQWRVEYELDNELQLQRLTLDLKPKLLGYLRRQLNNESIDIIFTISAHQDKTTAQPYTDSEKWQALVEKYPALASLKSKFGLDFE
jgi:DNA polymerase III subunit gamma/tau